MRRSKDSKSNFIIGKGNEGPKAYKLAYQLKRMTWEFHAYDRDFYPSVSHGHIGKYRLDIITGAIIDVTTHMTVGYLDKKEKERLFKDRKFQSLAYTARQFYQNINPGTKLPNIEFTTDRSRSRITHVNLNNETRRFGHRIAYRGRIISNGNLKYLLKLLSN